jgi:hypothetical protein
MRCVNRGRCFVVALAARFTARQPRSATHRQWTRGQQETWSRKARQVPPACHGASRCLPAGNRGGAAAVRSRIDRLGTAASGQAPMGLPRRVGAVAHRPSQPHPLHLIRPHGPSLKPPATAGTCPVAAAGTCRARAARRAAAAAPVGRCRTRAPTRAAPARARTLRACVWARVRAHQVREPAERAAAPVENVVPLNADCVGENRLVPVCAGACVCVSCV